MLKICKSCKRSYFLSSKTAFNGLLNKRYKVLTLGTKFCYHFGGSLAPVLPLKIIILPSNRNKEKI